MYTGLQMNFYGKKVIIRGATDRVATLNHMVDNNDAKVTREIQELANKLSEKEKDQMEEITERLFVYGIQNNYDDEKLELVFVV